MNATTRFKNSGLKFELGQTLSIPFYKQNIEHVLLDGEYVALRGSDFSIYDVALNRETAQTMADELGDDGSGFVLVKVTKRGQEVQQYWRDIVADCWGFQN